MPPKRGWFAQGCEGMGWLDQMPPKKWGCNWEYGSSASAIARTKGIVDFLEERQSSDRSIKRLKGITTRRLTCSAWHSKMHSRPIHHCQNAAPKRPHMTRGID